MKTRIHKLLLFFLILTLNACAISKITFYCEQPEIEIYVDGEYIGKDLVCYIFKPNQTSAGITAQINGKEIYRRVIDVKLYKNSLFEIKASEIMKYSNSHSIYKSKP